MKGSPPPSQEFLKLEGGVGGTSGAVGGLCGKGAGVTVSLRAHLPQVAPLLSPTPFPSSSSARGGSSGDRRGFAMRCGRGLRRRETGRDGETGRAKAKRWTETERLEVEAERSARVEGGQKAGGYRQRQRWPERDRRRCRDPHGDTQGWRERDTAGGRGRAETETSETEGQMGGETDRRQNQPWRRVKSQHQRGAGTGRRRETQAAARGAQSPQGPGEQRPAEAGPQTRTGAGSAPTCAPRLDGAGGGAPGCCEVWGSTAARGSGGDSSPAEAPPRPARPAPINPSFVAPP